MHFRIIASLFCFHFSLSIVYLHRIENKHFNLPTSFLLRSIFSSTDSPIVNVSNRLGTPILVRVTLHSLVTDAAEYVKVDQNKIQNDFPIIFYFFIAFNLYLDSKIGVTQFTRDVYVFRGHVDQPAVRIPMDNTGT